MKNKIRIIIYWMVFVIAVSCSKLDVEDDKSSSEVKDNEIWNPLIVLSREDIVMVRAKANKLYKNLNEMALLIGNVEIDFYNEDGDHSSILFSDSARIDEKSNDLYASGNVYVVSDSGYTLRTANLEWDNNYEMIVADDSVMFSHPEGDTLYGIGFESDIDLERFKIFRPFGILREGM